MSVKVSKTRITMTRGDTLKIRLNITDGSGNVYTPVKEDCIRFAAKKAYSDEIPCIVKDIPYDSLLLQLDPEDTKKLDQPFDYIYDIQITMSDGTVDTFIQGILSITEEVD